MAFYIVLQGNYTNRVAAEEHDLFVWSLFWILCSFTRRVVF
jgi:hypothetical protein